MTQIETIGLVLLVLAAGLALYGWVTWRADHVRVVRTTDPRHVGDAPDGRVVAVATFRPGSPRQRGAEVIVPWTDEQRKRLYDAWGDGAGVRPAELNDPPRTPEG